MLDFAQEGGYLEINKGNSYGHYLKSDSPISSGEGGHWAVFNKFKV